MDTQLELLISHLQILASEKKKSCNLCTEAWDNCALFVFIKSARPRCESRAGFIKKDKGQRWLLREPVR